MPWLQCRQHWQFRPLKLMGKWLHPLVWYHINLIYTRWAYDVMITSLLCQNDVITSFWRNNDVIVTSCVHWTCIYYFVHSILIKIIIVSKRAPCCRKDEARATELKFLAEISSSRSDAVCPSVCLSGTNTTHKVPVCRALFLTSTDWKERKKINVVRRYFIKWKFFLFRSFVGSVFSKSARCP